MLRIESLGFALCLLGSGCGDSTAADVDASSTSGDGTDSADASDGTDTSDTSSGEEGGDGDGDTPANCEGDLGPGESNRSVTVDGQKRDYRLWIPANYVPSQSTALVLNYHGFGSNAGQQVFFSQLNDYADEQGFMVAYPEGLTNANGSQAHNGGPGCCADTDRDDVAFARALVDDLKQDACVDQRRIFATGMSNGGYMSYRLACDAADLIAAIAPVSGALGLDPSDCQPTRAVPAIVFNGTADPTVPYAAGSTSVGNYTSILACPSDPSSSEVFGSVTCETWSACAEDAEVVFCSAEGMGHCWPGQEFCLDGVSTTDVSANEMMWDFFTAHPMPTP